MKTQPLVLATLLVLALVPPTVAKDGSQSAHQPRPQRQSRPRPTTVTFNRHLEGLHNEYCRNCGPGRAHSLVMAMNDPKLTGAQREAVKRRVAVMARYLSPDDRSNLRRISLIEINFQKHQEQQARKQAHQLPPSDCTSDKQMEQLAIERAQQMR